MDNPLTGLLSMLQGGQPQQPQMPQGGQPSGLFGGNFGANARDLMAGLAMGTTPQESMSMAGRVMALRGDQRAKQQQTQAQQNKTLQWLQTQGVDAGTASYLASDPAAMRAWFAEAQKGQTPQWQIHDLDDGKYMVDMHNPERRKKISELKQDAPASVQEYKFYEDQARKAGETPLPYGQWDISRKKAGATSVPIQLGTQAPDGKLREKLDEGTAKNWSAWDEAGHVSAGQLQDMQMLDELIKVAPQGPLTGRLAEMLPGVSSAADAFNSIVKRVAPTMRAPGSGATSDIEYDGFLRSLPALRNKPEANAAISEMMKAKAAINMERSDIISQYRQNQISRNDAEARLSGLNRRSIMTPAMRQMLAGLGGKGDVPLAGDVVDGYRFKGGDPANQASWEKAQ